MYIFLRKLNSKIINYEFSFHFSYSDCFWCVLFTLVLPNRHWLVSDEELKAYKLVLLSMLTRENAMQAQSLSRCRLLVWLCHCWNQIQCATVFLLEKQGDQSLDTFHYSICLSPAINEKRYEKLIRDTFNFVKLQYLLKDLCKHKTPNEVVSCLLRSFFLSFLNLCR